jgi:hypothetical protein
MRAETINAHLLEHQGIHRHPHRHSSLPTRSLRNLPDSSSFPPSLLPHQQCRTLLPLLCSPANLYSSSTEITSKCRIENTAHIASDDAGFDRGHREFRILHHHDPPPIIFRRDSGRDGGGSGGECGAEDVDGEGGVSNARSRVTKQTGVWGEDVKVTGVHHDAHAQGIMYNGLKTK